MAGAVAASKVESAAIDAEIVHVPAVTKATAPVEALTVQTGVVKLVKVIAPVPVDAVAVIVGGVEVDEEKDPESIVSVRTWEREKVAASAFMLP